MMTPTHVAAGLLLAAPVAVVSPELAVPAAVGGAVGGALPDLDVLVGTHRRTLHYPDYYWVVAGVAGAVALLVPGRLTVAVAVAAVAAGVHSVSDWFGAGNELRPWERTSDEAVYLHHRDAWLAPRYWVRYDGAPEDLLLTAVLSAPALVVFDPPIPRLVALMVAVAAVYALVRRRLPDVGERLFEDP